MDRPEVKKKTARSIVFFLLIRQRMPLKFLVFYTRQTMPEQLSRYTASKIRKEAAEATSTPSSSSSSSSSSASFFKLAHWRPVKIPPQVVIMRLKCIASACASTDNEDSSSSSPASSADSNNKKRKRSDDLPESLQSKIEELQFLLHHSPEQCNFLRNKQSHCFWCTCAPESDAAPNYFVPLKVSHETSEVTGYGHFCSPNCALAWLYQEDIPQHEKHEREQLIHLLFAPKGSSERFRPSPDPRVVLEKFAGTLTEPEYRTLFQSNYFVYPMNYNVTRQWKELPEMTDAKICQYYGRDFAGFRTGYHPQM